MATLTEAERARAQQAEFLRRLGAHAIGVEPVDNVTEQEAKAPPGATGKAWKSNKAKKRKGSTSQEDRSNAQSPKRAAEFAVIAYFEEAPKEPLPDALEIQSGNRRLKVPLALHLAPRFRLE